MQVAAGLGKEIENLFGDMLLAACEVVYLGPFSETFRAELLEE